MDAAHVAPWVAVIVALFSLFVQAYNIITGRKKERFEMQEALDKAPLVREQLELGNVSGAVETLNLIIQNQNTYIATQEERHRNREAELQEEIDQLRREIAELRAQLALRGANNKEGEGM